MYWLGLASAVMTSELRITAPWIKVIISLRVWYAAPSLQLLPQAWLQPHAPGWWFLHFREQDGERHEEEQTKCIRIMHLKGSFQELPLDTFTKLLALVTTQSVACLATRKARKRSLNAEWLQARLKFGVLSYYHRREGWILGDDE